MTFSQQAYQNRAIRTIQAELDFLVDTQLLPSATHAQILSLLPTLHPVTPAPPGTSPTPLPTSAQSATPAVQHFAYRPPHTPIATSATPAHEKASQGPVPTPPQPPAYTPQATPPVLGLAEALWAFTGSDAGDLSFNAGDTIEVLEKTKDEWWRGRVVGSKTGEVGLFPSAYVREKEPTMTPSLPPRKTGYGPGGNMMTDVASGSQQPQEGEKKQSALGKNGEKFGKKLGNAAIFGAGATMGSKIVNGIF